MFGYICPWSDHTHGYATIPSFNIVFSFLSLATRRVQFDEAVGILPRANPLPELKDREKFVFVCVQRFEWNPSYSDVC